MLAFLDRLRIRRRLRRVVIDLAARPVGHLTPDQRVRRREAIRELNHYRRWKRLPRNTYIPGRRPVFVDDRGARCAVAHLAAVSGAEDVVNEIRASQNLEYVRDLESPALLAWASARGLTTEELAEIQPAYDFLRETNWTLTWTVVSFAGVALIALAVAISNLVRRLARPWLGWVALAVFIAGTATATGIYAHASRPAECAFSCPEPVAAGFVQTVMIGLWIASGLFGALALQGWKQRRRPRGAADRFRRAPFPMSAPFEEVADMLDMSAMSAASTSEAPKASRR